MALPAPDPTPTTPGDAVVEVVRSAGRSVVARASARSPLQLLLPRNHGDAIWAFLSSLGGGLVDRDRLTLAVTVGPGAAAMLSTQASTKVYRSPSGCAQHITASVGSGGLLVVLPDPVSCFCGARLDQSVTVTLAPDASVLILDALTCGRAARDERWAFSRYRSALTVIRQGTGTVYSFPIVRDVVELDAGHGDIAARMGRFEAMATVVAIGPRVPALDVSGASRGDAWVAARSALGEGVMVRAAATTAEGLHRGVRELLVGLPAVLGDDPFARKF